MRHRVEEELRRHGAKEGGHGAEEQGGVTEVSGSIGENRGGEAALGAEK